MPDTETVSALCYTTFSCSYLPDRADGEKTKSNCIYTYIYTHINYGCQRNEKQSA